MPKGVKVDIPLQAYFRINTENMGQFERTLIIVDEDAYVHYVEGCTAPIYSSDSLHSAVVEIIVKPGGRCRYDDSKLVQQRLQPGDETGGSSGRCDHGMDRWKHRVQGHDEVPGGLADGEHAKGETLSIAFAGEGQHQDLARRWFTALRIPRRRSCQSRSRVAVVALLTEAWFRCSKVRRVPKSTVRCDALLVDDISRSDTYPYADVREDDVSMGHEASVSKVGEDQLFYLMSRGMTEEEAMAMIVRGFVEPIARELPMEYALELNRLIELQMEGAVG